MKPTEYYKFERPELLDMVPREAVHILDVGCGAGKLGENIKKRQNAVVYGVELENKAAELAATKLDRVWNCSIEKALAEIADETLDCIITADVLEHLVDPWSVLKQLQRKLKYGGKIVASIPNVQHWSVVHELLQGKWEYTADGLLDNTHLRFFTRNSVQELFWAAGLRIVTFSANHRGEAPPKSFVRLLQNLYISSRSIKEDSQVWQFLIQAEKPCESKTWPKVAIVVLNWNGKDDTVECVESVEKIAYPNFETIIVDNGSTDDSVATFRQRFPKAAVIETDKNLGYAEGNNCGIRRALANGADYVFVLNNDTTVDANVLNHLVGIGELEPNLGILGPSIYEYCNPEAPSYTYTKFDNEHLNCISFCAKNTLQVSGVDGLIGCAMLIKAKVFKEIGLLEQSFFLCYEEHDFCFRTRAAGFNCVVVTPARIWHKVGAALGEIESPVRIYFNTRNRLLWAERNLPVNRLVTLWKLILLQLVRNLFPKFYLGRYPNAALAKKLYWAAREYRREVRENYAQPIFKAQLWGVRDYLRRHFGNCPESVRGLSKLV